MQKSKNLGYPLLKLLILLIGAITRRRLATLAELANASSAVNQLGTGFRQSASDHITVNVTNDPLNVPSNPVDDMDAEKGKLAFFTSKGVMMPWTRVLPLTSLTWNSEKMGDTINTSKRYTTIIPYFNYNTGAHG